MENEIRVKFGLYSAAAVVAGSSTNFYLNPAGEEVEVTVVMDNPEVYNWPDAENRGPVLEWVRPGREGQNPDSERILKRRGLETPAMEELRHGREGRGPF